MLLAAQAVLFTCAERKRLELEHLGRAVPGAFDVVDGVVHHQLLRCGSGGFQVERQGDPLAQSDHRRGHAQVMELHLGLGAGAHDGQRAGVALLDQAAQRMAGDPGGVRVIQVPAFDQAEYPIRVVLGDVIEVVGHGFAYVEAAVGLEVVEDRRTQLGVGLHRGQAKRPRQARARAFAGEAAHVFVVIQRPRLHDRQGAFEVVEQEVSYGEFSRAKGGEVFERGHGALEVIQAVARHVVRQA